MSFFGSLSDKIAKALGYAMDQAKVAGGEHVETLPTGEQVWSYGEGEPQWKVWVDEYGDVQSSIYQPVSDYAGLNSLNSEG